MIRIDPLYPSDWYWAASDGRLYGSARQTLVAQDDAAFAAWQEAERGPTAWPRDDAGTESVTALQAVLTRYGLWVDLAAYAADRRWRAETAGIVVAGALIATDRESQALITGARLYAQATPGAIFQFKAGGGFVTLDGAQIEAVALAVAAHVQACFAVEAGVLAEIAAGTITTLPQVDGAAWPGGESNE